ncbi:hypothetical protein V6N11_050359 [Hibiscus sabdariffa]|uniref:Uncharacterized protein n=1 Tax=Hibiscus sabdariffa TaxID=183260 RepID=A0ABR2T9R4_9ROSI
MTGILLLRQMVVAMPCETCKVVVYIQIVWVTWKAMLMDWDLRGITFYVLPRIWHQIRIRKRRRAKSFAQKGLRVKKPVMNGKEGLGVVEWLKSTHAPIDAFCQQSCGEPNENSRAMDASHNVLQVSNDEESWEEN